MGNFVHDDAPTIRVIASSKSWIETEAVEQLKNTAKLSGMKVAVGLPDLHPGKAAPIGAAFITAKYIYAHLVGNDIGCGMGLWQTDLRSNQIKLDKWVSRLNDLDSKMDISAIPFAEYGVKRTDYDFAIGTIGGGNHFAELQRIETVTDEETFQSFNLDRNNLFLLVHSGSRGVGEAILSEHSKLYGSNGLHENTAEAKAYLSKHDNAVKWAKLNRMLIANRFFSSLRCEGKRILDVCHNNVVPLQIEDNNYWLHRKGATPADEKLVVIPGSRGDFSYLVQPINSHIGHAFSLAHGAGRKWQRTYAKSRLAKFKKEELVKTKLGSIVICESKDLIYEEAPQAYKKIDQVIQDLVDEGLIKIIAILRPLITYKTRSQQC